MGEKIVREFFLSPSLYRKWIIPPYITHIFVRMTALLSKERMREWWS